MTLTLHNTPKTTGFAMPGFIKVSFIVLLIFCAKSSVAQSTMYTIKGDQIRCKVQEIGEDSITYFAVDNKPNEKWKMIAVKEVARIISADGKLEFGTKATAAIISKAVTVTPASTPGGAIPDVIVTIENKQIPCKVVDVDLDDKIITYEVAGNKEPQKIYFKYVASVNHEKGAPDIYNVQGKSQVINTANLVKRAPVVVDEKDAMNAAVQSWKKKYMATPLEIF